MSKQGWKNESRRHALASKGIKSTNNAKTPVPHWMSDEAQNEFREDAYMDKIDVIVDILNEDKALPYIKEGEFIAVRTDFGIHIFDTKQKRVFETLYYDEKADDTISYGAKDGFLFGQHPLVETHEYLREGEYEERYNTYVSNMI